MSREFIDWCLDHKLLLGFILAGLFLGAPLVLMWIGPTNPVLELWLLTLSGNWSPSSYPGIDQHPLTTPGLSWAQSYGFSFFGVLAVLINNAMIGVIIGLVFQYYRDRSALMTLTFSQALKTRDIKIEAAVRHDLREVMPEETYNALVEKIHAAFKEASEVWERETIEKVFGKGGAKRIRTLLHATVDNGS